VLSLLAFVDAGWVESQQWSSGYCYGQLTGLYMELISQRIEETMLHNIAQARGALWVVDKCSQDPSGLFGRETTTAID